MAAVLRVRCVARFSVYSSFFRLGLRSCRPGTGLPLRRRCKAHAAPACLPFMQTHPRCSPPLQAADWREQAILQFRIMRKRALRQTLEKLAAKLGLDADGKGSAGAAKEPGRLAVVLRAIKARQ